jgi:hypothetical protein
MSATFFQTIAVRRGQTSSKRRVLDPQILIWWTRFISLLANFIAHCCASTGYAKCGRRTSTPLNLRRGLCIHQISCLTFLYMPARIPQRIFREPCCGQLNELSSRAWMCQICNKNKCFLPKTTAAAPIHYLPWFGSAFADTCSALEIRVVRLWFMTMSEK